MSWNDRQGPLGKDQQSPPIDEMLERLQKKLRTLFGGKQLPVFWILGIILLILWMTTGIYQVKQDEVGIVQRFGRYSRTADSGLHWKLPTGIEKVTKVAVQHIYQEEFGLRTLRAGIRTEYAPERQYESESLMLTGDLNCALVPWVVRYQVGDPYKFLYRVRNVRKTLRDLAEATMRRVVGDHTLDEVINNRERISLQAQDALQEALDVAESGLLIKTIELGKTNVPGPVQASFNEVNSAVQEKEKLIYQAQGALNKVIPEARGQATKRIQGSEGYAVDRVKRAQGEVARFSQLLEEYVKAKEITRQRLYLEAMEKMFPRLGKKYVIDPEQRSVLPLLNLSEKGEQP